MIIGSLMRWDDRRTSIIYHKNVFKLSLKDCSVWHEYRTCFQLKVNELLVTTWFLLPLCSYKGDSQEISLAPYFNINVASLVTKGSGDRIVILFSSVLFFFFLSVIFGSILELICIFTLTGDWHFGIGFVWKFFFSNFGFITCIKETLFL